jgi:hypothetical protein
MLLALLLGRKLRAQHSSRWDTEKASANGYVFYQNNPFWRDSLKCLSII